MPSLAEQGLRFIQRCAAKPAAAAADDFLSTVKQFGFSAAAGGAWAGVGRNRQNRFFFVSWSREWLEFYEKSQFSQHDPLLAESRRRMSAFWFSEVIAAVKLTQKQKELLAAAAAYGYRDVFAVPIHGPGNMQGVVSLAAPEHINLDAADRAVLEAMSRAVWERCRTSEGFGVSTPERAHLSPRGIECLQWAAAGKSDADIATLVGISEATAHFHIEQAKKKLGVRTRVEAVAVAVLQGLI
jgi:DNA-binding CsgD family transcriptional regulator